MFKIRAIQHKTFNFSMTMPKSDELPTNSLMLADGWYEQYGHRLGSQLPSPPVYKLGGLIAIADRQ